MLKRILLLSVSIFAIYTQAHACEVCGCAATSGSYSILPQFRQHFIGLSYVHQSFSTSHPPSLLDLETPLTSTEYFNSWELWGRWNVSKRWQVMAFLPFRNNIQHFGEDEFSFSGLGDARALALYELIDFEKEKNPWRVNLRLGLGVSAPTGSYENDKYNGDIVHRNLQTGTGAWGVNSTAIFTLRRKALGLINTLNYSHFTSNPSAVRFGDRWNINTQLFYWLEARKVSVLPKLGWSFDYFNQDRENGEPMELSGGGGHALSIGMDIYFKRFALIAEWRTPFAQTWSANSVEQRDYMALNILYSF